MEERPLGHKIEISYLWRDPTSTNAGSLQSAPEPKIEKFLVFQEITSKIEGQRPLVNILRRKFKESYLRVAQKNPSCRVYKSAWKII